MYPQGFTVYALSSLPCDVLDEIPFCAFTCSQGNGYAVNVHPNLQC